jgi:hypothetical protein
VTDRERCDGTAESVGRVGSAGSTCVSASVRCAAARSAACPSTGSGRTSERARRSRPLSRATAVEHVNAWVPRVRWNGGTVRLPKITRDELSFVGKPQMLTSLSYDVDGHCSARAPRFNVPLQGRATCTGSPATTGRSMAQRTASFP